jgi:hypothetical protein
METRRAFRIFWVSGLVSVLLDLDHPYSIILSGTIYPSIKEARLFHPLALFTACCVLLYLSTSIGRLYCKLVLRRRNESLLANKVLRHAQRGSRKSIIRD